MPFIIPPTNKQQYIKFKYLIEKYKHAVSKDPTAHCLAGFTAAAILRSNTVEPADNLDSFESWLKTFDITESRRNTAGDNAVIDQMIATLDSYYRQQEDQPQDLLEEDNMDIDEEMLDRNGSSSYDLKRYTSRNPYFESDSRSYPIHNYQYQPKYSFIYEHS